MSVYSQFAHDIIFKLIEMCGLLQPHSENPADYALQVHRQKGENQSKVAARFRKYFPHHRVSDSEKLIYFIGVWDITRWRRP